MMVSTRGSVLRMVWWQWRYALVMIAAATAAVLTQRYLGLGKNLLPALPLAVVGGALGIFVSFRTNSAYDRWWEGRKLWGSLINASRHFATQTLEYLPSEERSTAERLVRRHIAYVHSLRVLLRAEAPQADALVGEFLPEGELAELKHESNLTHALLDRQFRELREMVDRGALSEFRLASMDVTLRDFLNYQGGCERIKKTPMPMVYGFLAHRLVMAFGILFPFAVAHQLSWAVIPINLLVGLGFALISEAGRVLEDPFTNFYNGLPLMSLSKTIEHNLRHRIGETDLPPLPTPDKSGVLM